MAPLQQAQRGEKSSWQSLSQYGRPSLSKKPVVLSSILQAVHTKCSGCHTSPRAVIIYRTEKKKTSAVETRRGLYLFHLFFNYYYSDFRTYNISMLVRLFNVPFPQCIYCRKHSGPWLWCVHQSSPSQSSALLAGHRQYLFSCSQSRPLHLNLLFCCRCCCCRSPCCLVAHLLFFFSQTVSV